MMDMHCHLDLYEKPFDVAQQCHEKGIYVLSVTTTPKAWHGTYKLSINKPRIRTALGLHPQVAHDRYHELELFDSLINETRYIGEIGLDGGQGFIEHWDTQLMVFRHILKSVHKSGGKIMSIHSRLSTRQVLSELNNIDGIAILHWFTGTQAQLKQAADMDCWFSVGPAMLNTKKGQALVKLMPRNRVLLETDGPFAKYNGTALMPWDTENCVEVLSRIWKISLDDVKFQIYQNLKLLTSISSL